MEKEKGSAELEVRIGNLRATMKQTISLIVALIGLIAGVATIFVFMSPALKSSIDTQTRNFIETIITNEINTLRSDLDDLAQQIRKTKTKLESLSKVPDETKISAHLKQQNDKLIALNERLTKMEKAVLADPSKALEMPMLRKEIEHLHQSYETDVLALRNEISRIYDLNKWFIGLMFSMAIGTIGLAMTNFIRPPRKD